MVDDTISVVVGTFGDPMWISMAERALESVRAQTVAPVDVVHVHANTLHEARNQGAEQTTGKFLCFLDADDELDPGYIEAMTEAISTSRMRSDSKWFLYRPATLGVVNGIEDDESVMLPERPIQSGNFMVIGTVVQHSLFDDVGGFMDWPMFEDWCLWIRCMKVGAKPLAVPDAIYRVHVSPGSRNKGDHQKVFNDIRKRHFG